MSALQPPSISVPAGSVRPRSSGAQAGAAHRLPIGWAAWPVPRVLVVLVALLVLAAVAAPLASAAVTHRSSSSDNGTAQDFSCLGPNANAQVPVPAGTVAGDVMIATVAASGSGAETAPSGWTLLAQNTASQSQKVFMRVRAAGDPGTYTWTSAGFCAGQSAIVATIDTYTGVDPTEPITAGARTTSGGSASLPMPDDTALEPGSLRVSSAAAHRTNSTAMTTTWSGLTPTSSRNVTYGSNSLSVSSASMAQDAGPTTAATATLNQAASGAMAYTVVLRPEHTQQLGFATQPAGGVAEGVNLPSQPVVALRFGDGATNTGDTSDVTLSKASGPAAGVLTCAGGLTRAAVAGLASFSGCQITGTQASGTYTIRATSPGLPNATSSSFTIVVGPAARLDFTTQPAGGVAQNVALPTQPAVTVRDAYGNTVTGSSATITLAIASGPGTGVLSCTGGLGRAASAGTATFSGCSITGTAAAGTYTVTATAAGLTPATSASFVIVVGPPAVVVFTTQPVGDVAEGVALPTQPVARVRDAHGNTVTSSSATITLSIASGPGSGVLNCVGGASRAAVAGVATFSGCQIIGTAAAGTYALGAASGALTPDTSSTFAITPGAATRLTITTQPVGGVPEGTDLPTQPRVTVQDAFANTVTTATTPVSLAIASGPAAGVLGCTANPRSASAGVATFSGCQITGTAAAGTYTLTASGGGLAADTSASFTITAGAATQLVFATQPVGGVVPGTPLSTQPTVGIRDAFGNPVTTGSPTVTLTVASGPGGTLACSSATTSAVGGSAAFTGCRIQGASGTYALTATSGALTPATSATFVIDAGALTVTADDYAYGAMALTGFDQVSTATLPIHVSDTTGSGAGWRISASAGPWTGGTVGSLDAQRVGAPPTASCDGGPGTCTPATPGPRSWPIALAPTPTVIYDAAAETGTGPQTILFPMSLPLAGNLFARGAFSQQVTVTVAAGP